MSPTLVLSKTPSETLVTLLNLVRHGEQRFQVREIKGAYDTERLEVEFENGVRYDLKGSAYSGCVNIYGPGPRTLFIAEYKIGDMVLASRAFETPDLRTEFINKVPEDQRHLFVVREEEVK